MSQRIVHVAALAVLIASAATFAASSASAATIEILIDDMEFKTPVAQAKIGDIVRWTNKDVFAHTATAQGKDFDVAIEAGATATLLLSKAGTFEYYCVYHPNMMAKLIVVP